jgi:hypothetical protein
VKSILRAIVGILAASLAVLAVTAPYATAATLFENYQTSDGSAVGPASPSQWVAQTFTATSNHTIRYVQLRGYRETSLTTGTITVSIRATDANGYPVGPDLTAASEVVTTIPYTAGWFTINLPIIAVTAGTRYALVVRISNAAYGSEFWWSGDTVKGYPDGAGFDSVNGGTSWTPGGLDLLFNIFGDATSASVQTRAPTANSYPGFDDWYMPENAYTNGDGNAIGGQNVYHYYNNYNFSIPSGATINGIEVRLDAAYYPPGWTTGSGKFRVRLSWDHGTNKTTLGLLDSANLTSSEATYFVGGPTFTGGRTWSPSDFTNANFEVQIVPYSTLSIVTNPNQKLTLDFIPVTVYYTPPPPALPTVTTAGVTGISTTSATSGGDVTNDGGAPVTARGICWSTAADPTIANSCTTDGTGTGVFASSLTGLTPATGYHVRAYATNSTGTAYGDDLPFATNAPLSLMIQGNGNGIVHSGPPDINCSSGTCGQEYPFGANITLTPTISGHSLFHGWSGDCTNPDGNCPLFMDRSRVVLATFDINPAEAVWVDPGTQYYGAIDSAYQAAATSGSQIKACRIDFPGDLVFDLGKTVSLKGGYNSTYSSNNGYNTLIGKVTLKSGNVTFENIVIR